MSDEHDKAVDEAMRQLHRAGCAEDCWDDDDGVAHHTDDCDYAHWLRKYTDAVRASERARLAAKVGPLKHTAEVEAACRRMAAEVENPLGGVLRSLWNEIDATRAQVAALRAEVERLTGEKNGAYRERDQVVALAARLALQLGLVAGLGRHDEADAAWDRAWMNIVFIDLPSGQVSWHVHDDEMPFFAGLPEYTSMWDGHSTPEKYRRALNPGLALAPNPSALRAERDAARAALAGLSEAAESAACVLTLEASSHSPAVVALRAAIAAAQPHVGRKT